MEETAQAVETLSGLFAGGRMTVLLVEHDMEVVFRLAHRITVLHRGAVIADGLPEGIKQDERVQGAYLTARPDQLGTPPWDRRSRFVFLDEITGRPVCPVVLAHDPKSSRLTRM